MLDTVVMLVGMRRGGSKLYGYAQEEGQFLPRCFGSLSMSYGLFVEGYSHALEPRAEFST